MNWPFMLCSKHKQEMDAQAVLHAQDKLALMKRMENAWTAELAKVNTKHQRALAEQNKRVDTYIKHLVRVINEPNPLANQFAFTISFNSDVMKEQDIFAEYAMRTVYAKIMSRDFLRQ